MLRNAARNVLTIVADKTESNPSSAVMDVTVIRETGLPDSEARKYINELVGLDLIRLGIKVSGADFRMLNITKEGIRELQNQEDR